MSLQKTIVHPEWGTVILKKNKRAKRLILRIKDDTVQVTLPTHVPYQTGLQLVNDKKAWIEERLAKNRKQAQLNEPLELALRHKTLHIAHHTDAGFKAEWQEGQVFLYLPPEATLAMPETKTILAEILRHEAKQYLPQRTRALAAQHGIPINKVTVKNVRTRWGSCSNRGNINLSLHLMLLPDAWIDYVITHELAHIKHPNHSPAFWAHLEALMPGAKAIDQALKGYRRPF